MPPTAEDFEPSMRFRPVLVPLHRAVEALSVRPEVVLDWVDSGRLLWVWDISQPQGYKRNYRFWLAELLGAPVAGLRRHEAIAQVIGTAKQRLQIREVEQILFVRRDAIHRLLICGELNGHHGKPHAWVLTASLGDFLKRRIVW